MRLLCNLIKQYPKPSKPVLGNVTIVNEVDNAMFFDKQERCVAMLVRPRLKFITAIGMFFTGFEDKGCDKYGKVKYIYQEWWCPFIDVVEE